MLEKLNGAVGAVVALEDAVSQLELLCRVVGAASGDDPPDWLSLVWASVARVQVALDSVSVSVREPFVDKVLGEGPRSGEGEALSGAGAKRREGAQPPAELSGDQERAS